MRWRVLRAERSTGPRDRRPREDLKAGRHGPHGPRSPVTPDWAQRTREMKEKEKDTQAPKSSTTNAIDTRTTRSTLASYPSLSPRSPTSSDPMSVLGPRGEAMDRLPCVLIEYLARATETAAPATTVAEPTASTSTQPTRSTTTASPHRRRRAGYMNVSQPGVCTYCATRPLTRRARSMFRRLARKGCARTELHRSHREERSATSSGTKRSQPRELHTKRTVPCCTALRC